MSTALFTAKTANGSSSAVAWKGGTGLVVMWGTWDTSTMVLECSLDGTNYAPVTVNGTACSGTADIAFAFNLPVCLVRATLSSVGASTSVNAILSD